MMDKDAIRRIRQNQATIKDVEMAPLVAHVDDRGYLMEILRATDPHFTKYGQLYIVGTRTRGTIRAFHKHEVMWDWFFISHGSAKFVLVDDREDSPTYKDMNVFVTCARNPVLIVVPPGVYHGSVSLEDNTLLISTASEVYNRERPDEVRIPHDSFGDVWTIQAR